MLLVFKRFKTIIKKDKKVFLMNSNDLTTESITFGKYKGLNLQDILKDRSYCKWLLQQEWFKSEYEYLYNRVLNYNPNTFFFKEESGDFLTSYKYFNLLKLNELGVELSPDYKKCYEWYLNMIETIKQRIIQNTNKVNPYDIKAPVKWLQNFEKDTNLSRNVFKQFLSEYELENITTIIETIKIQGGITYNGAKSYKIAKERSTCQEGYWEEILKNKYGEDISVQFKLNNCFFDFLHIKNKVIYECKLGLKDFNRAQYDKYLMTLGEYNIVYLVSDNLIIDIKDKKIKRINEERINEERVNEPSTISSQEKFTLDLSKIKDEKFREMIQTFEIINIPNDVKTISEHL